MVDQCLGRKWFPDNCWRPGQLLICASRAAHQLLSSCLVTNRTHSVCVCPCAWLNFSTIGSTFFGERQELTKSRSQWVWRGRPAGPGRPADWQPGSYPRGSLGFGGSVLGQPLDQGPKDSGLRLSGKSGAQKLARCRLEFGFCRALDFPGTLTLKQVAPTNRRRGSPPVRLQLLR